MRRFELQEGKASKFWEVETSGSELTVRFGRIGAAGQTKTKAFADAASAAKEHDKLVKEKTGKGYAEVGASSPSTLPRNASVAVTARPEPAADAMTNPAAATPQPVIRADAVAWPQGGFQWHSEWRAALPIVRGAHAPAPRFVGSYQLEEAQQQATLAGCDPNLWRDLFKRAASAGGEYQRHVTREGIARHGLPFMLHIAVDFAEASISTGTRLYPETFGVLRHAIASAADNDYQAVCDAAQRERTRSDAARLMCAHLFAHIEQWAVEALQQSPREQAHLLNDCALPPQLAVAHFKALPQRLYYSHPGILLQLLLHGAAALDLLSLLLTQQRERDGTLYVLSLVVAMRAPQMLRVLVQHMDNKDVAAALEGVAKQYPAAALVAAIEHVCASRSPAVEAWAVRLAVREPQARASALASLSEADRSRFEAVLGALEHEEAELEAVPPLLREPPWLQKQLDHAPPTLELVPLVAPERIEWDATTRADYAAHQPYCYLYNAPPDEPGLHRYILRDRLHIMESAFERVLRGEPISKDDLTDSQYPSSMRCAYELAIALQLPPPAALTLWNNISMGRWETNDVMPIARLFLARHDLAAMPGFVGYVQKNPADGLEVAVGVDSPRIVPTALHALRNSKTCKAQAARWITAHLPTTLRVALPQAFGKDKTLKDNAQHALRWLAQNGQLDSVRAVAEEYGGAVPTAVTALLNADPLLMFPARMPKLPSFFEPAALTRPQLNVGGALPLVAIRHLGTILAISKLEARYAGLEIVKQACTPASLAQFAWDLFQAWLISGAPSAEIWCFTALGLLGDDETARRLAPKIREWPGESAHQRAVTGLDLLAAIGSDVALMHLNGIAAKVKFKALQDRAREKIQTIAAARGLTAEQLADRLVPDLGLAEDGSLHLDFGPRQFVVGFDELLRPFIKDAQGVRLKDLPKPVKSDDAALASAASERYKQIRKDAKAIAGLQVTRLELAMVARRRWSAVEFRRFFLEHPLLRYLTARLVWGVYVEGTLQSAFRVAEDWSLADRNDSIYELSDDATVGIAHVLEMPGELQDAFGQVFADYEVLQPFKQLGREVYTASAAELLATIITRFKDEEVATGGVLGLVNRGWQRGAAQDSGWVNAFHKRVGVYDVQLQLDPGITVGDVNTDAVQTLPALCLQHSEERSRHGTVAFGHLDPISLSEVLRDIDSLPRVE